MLESLKGIGTHFFDQIDEIIDNFGQLIIFVDSHFKLGHPLFFQCQTRQGFTNFLHSGFRQFATLNKVTLVVITGFASEQKHTVQALGQGILDPDHVDGPQTSHRYETDNRRIFKPV